MKARPKSMFVKSFGCQMNVYDSERMEELLLADGYVRADSAEAADVVVLNTCHIREKAAEKVYSDIGRLKERPGADQGTIAVVGCVAQAEGAEIMRRAPAVGLVAGPQSYHELPRLLREAHAGSRPIALDFDVASKFAMLGLQKPRPGPTAFLTIQEGCDKFCTFCVVPYTRGGEVGRPVADIVAEAERLADEGVRDITLLGQNVNAYRETCGGRTVDFAELIGRLARIDGLIRIRYTTSHPREMTDELIAAHGSIAKLMPYLHLPVQSGSDRVLAAMNRKHGRDVYLDIVERLRKARPDIALSGDFIVGFPGETDTDFEATLDLVEQVNYAQAYSFKYSPRAGTPAATMADQVDEAVKSERLQRLQQLLNRQQAAFNAASIRRRFDILLERHGRHDGQFIGRSPYMQSVHVTVDDAALGDMVSCEIASAGPHSLEGRVLERADAC